MSSSLWAVLVASIVAFFSGWVWYSPMLFGKMFMKEEKVSDADMKKSQGKSMMRGLAMEFVGTVIGVHILNYLMMQLAVIDYREVWMLAFVLWFGMKLPVALSDMAWKQRSYRAIVLSLHALLGFGLAGSVLLAWR